MKQVKTNQDRDNVRSDQRRRIRPSSTGILAGLLWVPMACQTIWSKLAWHSPIVKSRTELRKLQVTLCLTRLDLALSTSLHSRSPISSQRFWPNILILKRTMVQCCSTWWVSVLRMLAWPNGPTSLQSDAWQCRFYKGKLQQMHQGLPWGHCWVPQCWGPADPLALYCQEARSSANALVHAGSSTAP